MPIILAIKAFKDFKDPSGSKALCMLMSLYMGDCHDYIAHGSEHTNHKCIKIGENNLSCPQLLPVAEQNLGTRICRRTSYWVRDPI
jgi:hypothetical protein